MAEKAKGMLSPYRVLDLADETGYLCGKVLGDLGADVIKIEKPGGDPGRNVGPFYHDEPDPEKSLLWFSYNNSKRGITLDIETADGREIFKRLVKTADVVIETFSPGYLDKLGLGYSALNKLDPKIILASITPFGQGGPWKNYKVTDLVAWALSGSMYVVGDADRPPVRVSHPQAYYHAGAEAAVGTVMALYHREVAGEGQWVNVAVQDAAVHATEGILSTWNSTKRNKMRGVWMAEITARVTARWRCKDGYVIFRYLAGTGASHRNLPFIEWMDAEGFATDFIKGIDWDHLDIRTATQEMIDRIEGPIAKFFLSHTKAELYAEVLKRRVEVYPVADVKDISESIQPKARKFWVELEHPELGASISYPGPFIMASEAPFKISRRAPLIGEHNQEIYEQELGISKEELAVLKQINVI